MESRNKNQRRLPSGAAAVVVCLATLAIGLPSAIVAQEKAITNSSGEDAKSPKEPLVLLYDPFEGKKFLNWKPVRFDPSHISFSKHSGKLTIITQRGTIHQDQKSRSEPIAKNFYVLENPLMADANFSITTCVSSFEPTQAFHQAGLICYDDDDNYLKFSYQFNWPEGAGTNLRMLTETAAVSSIDHAATPPDAKELWMRIEKRGKDFEFSASADGKEFVIAGKATWGNGAPKMLGVYAKNGGRDEIPEIDAVFDFFELRSLSTEEKK